MNLTTKHPHQSVADTIRKQMGVMGLGVVGASNLSFAKGSGYGALTFKARLHHTGQTRARIMRVFVNLNAMDTYDIDVVTPDHKNVRFASGVYADQLTATMCRLDSEGVEK